ncbi:MAG TPA: hypothetical protein VM409_01325, partial [Chloroflexia bacterium]|nr:hypothetical protein [Chloroflexia bacterium]
ADLVRETTNKDKEGSQRAYDDFHATFAANENDIKAKDAATQATLEDRMHEVRDAITAGNFDKAADAAKELQQAVEDADTKLMGGQGGGAGDLPTLGAGDAFLQTALALGAQAFGFILLGYAARRRSLRPN